MESLRVAVRIRPEDETVDGGCIITKKDSSFSSSSSSNDDSLQRITIVKDSNKENKTLIDNNSNATSYEFDRIFGTESSQSEVFEYAKPLVEECLKGFTVTIFAFGMTGSGKTHTISGDSHDVGILPRSVNHVFDRLIKMTSQSPDQVSMVCLTYVELYNNNLKDLLSDASASSSYDSSTGGDSLKIHEHPKRGIYLTGSPGIRTPVSSPEECMALIQKGNKTRATGSTNLNERSSRSHTVISLEIITRDLGSNCGEGEERKESEGIVSVGKLNLVDLAGSERVKMSGASGQTLEEAKQINKALSVLGDVLNSLGKYHQGLMTMDSSSSSSKAASIPHIPYRNSKLTMLLKDSLGGNSKTLMLTTIRMSSRFFQQTDMSLKYAARAKHIRNIPTQNIGFEEADGGGSHGANFMKKTLDEVARLKDQLNVRNKEYERLKGKLESIEREGSIHGKNDKQLEMEEGFRLQIEKITQQNEDGKKELQEHLSMLVHNHNSALAQKKAESKKMETKLKEHASVIENLSREKKVASINQHKANATVQELYRKIAQGQADLSQSESEKAELEKQLQVIRKKNREHETEKTKFVDAIKKLMDSRQKHKSRFAEIEAECLKGNECIESKNQEIQGLIDQHSREREENEQNFANVIEILKKSEEKIKLLTGENEEYKMENLRLIEQQGVFKVKEDEREESVGRSELDSSASTSTSVIPEKTGTQKEIEEEDEVEGKKTKPTTTIIAETNTNNDNELMKKDRLQVENVALRQKIRLMVEEEKYMMQQLQNKTIELNESKAKMLSMRIGWSEEASQKEVLELNKEGTKNICFFCFFTIYLSWIFKF